MDGVMPSRTPALLLAALLAPAAAHAQNAADGRQIAQTWCSNCHRVNPQEPVAAGDGPPPFTAIARMPSTTSISLGAFLSTTHGRMPDLALTRTQIQDVSAYILTLR